MAVLRSAFEGRRLEPAHQPRASAWRWAAIGSAVLILLTLPPILIAAIQTPATSVFSGYVVIARDAYVYQALWRQGWNGAWLFHSPYTSESVPGILLYPWYLWPAHVIGWAAGPWLYHVARVAAAAALLAGVWLLIRELFRSRLLRGWAFTLCTLGGGIGAFLPHEIRLGPLTTGATEMRSPGSSVADLIAMAAHLPWALALMCWAMVVALRVRRRLSLSELISGLAAVVGLQLIYPQLALLLVLVVGAWSLVSRLRRPLWYAAAAAGLQAPYLAYLLWLSHSAPQALAVIRPSLDVGDPFGFLVLSHLTATGLILVALWRRRLRGDLILPALWIVGMTLFMFLPWVSGSLGRSFMASSIPFGLCAAPGLLSLLRMLPTRAWRRRVLAATLALSSFYGIFSLAQPYWIASFRFDTAAEYESRAEAAILARLAPSVSARDIVLTRYVDGIFVPAQTNARAFDGHPEMTVDAGHKSDQANAFLDSWDDRTRAAFVRANGIDYVLATDAGSITRLEADPGLRLIDHEADVALFAVQP
ncbi:MAG TPA: hypothetical protein VFR68_04855 [Candidatus Dormibacteraeota bacterium]|nr:hypothetical protein [Candidatus Dormibacteraeota bacterium]